MWADVAQSGVTVPGLSEQTGLGGWRGAATWCPSFRSLQPGGGADASVTVVSCCFSASDRFYSF